MKTEDFQGSGQAKKGDRPDKIEEEDEDDVIDELMKDVGKKISLNTEENLKQTSMHHFKLKTRDVVEVYRFEGIEAVNAIL